MSSFQRTGPLPLLWCHHTDEPVGMIDTAALRDGTVWTAGTLLPPTASPRCSLAHACLDMGTAMGLSVGFNPVGDGYEKGEDGEVVWTELEWLETSVVAVPANAATSYGPAQARELDAVAYAVKALDAGYDITRPWLTERQQADWVRRVELRKAAEEIVAEMDGWRTRYPRPAPRSGAERGRQAPSAPVDLIALAETGRMTWHEAHRRSRPGATGMSAGWRGPVTATGSRGARSAGGQFSPVTVGGRCHGVHRAAGDVPPSCCNTAGDIDVDSAAERRRPRQFRITRRHGSTPGSTRGTRVPAGVYGFIVATGAPIDRRQMMDIHSGGRRVCTGRTAEATRTDTEAGAGSPVLVVVRRRRPACDRAAATAGDR